MAFDISSYQEGYTDGYEDARKHYAPTVEPRWIPTSEMLPEKYDSYLVMWRRRDEYSDRLFYEIIEYVPADDEGEGEWEQIEQAGKDGAEIVAWMPLPEMYEPKEVKNEIDADKLKAKLQEHHDFFVNAYGSFKNLPPNDKPRVDEITHCISEIVNAPTVEYPFYQEAYQTGYEEGLNDIRPQGEWIRHDEWRNGEYIGGFYHVNCPCEDGYYSKWTTNFCPNCGAEMRKGGTE